MTPEVLSWIDEQKPALVGAAERYVTKTRISDPDPAWLAKNREWRPPARGDRRGKRASPKVSRSQLRNLLNAAQAESPLAVLVNLLRYQIGRTDKGWKDYSSGEELIELMLAQVGRHIDQAAQDSPVAAALKTNRYAVESRLAALLLGYVVREFTYRCELAGTSHD